MHLLVVLVRSLLIIVAAIVHLLGIVLLSVAWIEPRAIRRNEGLALLVVVRKRWRMVGGLHTIAIVRSLVRLATEAWRRVLLRRWVSEMMLMSRVAEDRRRILVTLVVSRVQIVIVLLAILRRPHPLVHAGRPMERLIARCEFAWLPLRMVSLVCVRVIAWRRLGLRRTPKALMRWEPVWLLVMRRVLWMAPLHMTW